MIQQKNKIFFDDEYLTREQLPRQFSITFRNAARKSNGVRVILNDSMQIGDTVNDNSFEEDFYRYHDIFHYTFAAFLGWSPCSRAMMKCKRKSNSIIDEVQDGARAAITEEAVSLLVFNEAKRKEFFKSNKISKITLRIIKEMTSPFEVNIRSERDWEEAILKAYELFRLLVEHKGGKIQFDACNNTAKFFALN